MSYSFVSIGDSLTQGFRSFAVCREFQEYSFPYLIYKSNPALIKSFNIPNIDSPGFPINLEYILYGLETLDVINAEEKRHQKHLSSLIFSHAPRMRSSKSPNHNLGIYGFTTKQIYSSNFANSSTKLGKVLIPLERFPVLRYLSNISNLMVDAFRSIFSDDFISYNFSRTVYTVLSCYENGSDDLNELNVAIKICKAAKQRNEPCLVTYWAGSNDIIGALLSGDTRYITKTSSVIYYIEKTIKRLLEEPNTIITIADIPGIDHIPFIDTKSLTPIFPLYKKISRDVLEEISKSITDINKGIYDLVSNLDETLKSRIRVVKINDFFKKISKDGLYAKLSNNKTIKLSTDYLMPDKNGDISKGGIFGLDGVHPTATGYAFLANEFIKAFNELGVPLNMVNIDDVSRKDILLNSPPKLIPEFLDMNSDINKLAAKLGLYEYISTLLLSQFNINHKD